MSNSQVRRIDVYKSDNTDAVLSIKGLAVKEREIVVSHIVASDAWREEAAKFPEKDLRVKITNPFRIDNSITEQEIYNFFTDLGVDNLVFINAETGLPLNVIANNVLESLNVLPANASLARGNTLQYSVETTPAAASDNVTWEIEGLNIDISIDANGLLTADLGAEVKDYTITATSVENPEISGSTILTVTA